MSWRDDVERRLRVLESFHRIELTAKPVEGHCDYCGQRDGVCTCPGHEHATAEKRDVKTTVCFCPFCGTSFPGPRTMLAVKREHHQRCQTCGTSMVIQRR